MRIAEKVERVGAMLDELYPETPIPLKHRNVYTFLVAVLLSAQTTDKKVNQVTPTLFDRASTPAQMAGLDVEHIQEIIREIGLAPTKAKNLKRMAEQLVELHDGEVPQTFEELEELAGVGHKTASVVMVQAFGIPAFPVDTHIHWLAARWGLSNGRNVVQTERDLKRHFPEDQVSWYYDIAEPAYHFNRRLVYRMFLLMHRLLPPKFAVCVCLFVQKRPAGTAS